MLKALRNKKTAKRIFLFLAFIIVPAFVLWGSASSIRDKNEASFAGEIFGKKISIDDYRDAFIAVRNQAMIQFGDNFDNVRPILNLEERAWERLMLLEKVRQEKIRVPDKQVVETIAQYPFFQKDGLFNNEIYQQILRYGLEIDPKNFERHIRESLEIVGLFNKHTQDISITEQELLSKFKETNEKIKVSYISVNNKDFEQGITISDEQAKIYFENHKSKFLTDPKMNIEYLGLDLAQNATAEEKQKAKQKLTPVLELAKKTNDWIALAKENNLKHKITGSFAIGKPIPDIGLSTEFYNAILKIGTGQVSELIQTEQGFFIARLLEIIEPRVAQFGEIKDAVIEKIKKDKAKGLSFASTEDIKKTLEQNLKDNPKAAFANLAKDKNLKITETTFFNRNQYLENIGLSEEFSKQAFSLVANPAKLAVASTSNASYIIKLVDSQPIDLKQFEKEKEELREKLLGERKEKSFVDYLENLKLQAKLKDNLQQSRKNFR
jgi:peptidyl-prolyl cis-trans isomerase D